jgi:hypothetical protein
VFALRSADLRSFAPKISQTVENDRERFCSLPALLLDGMRARAKINAAVLGQSISQEISFFCEMSICESFRRYHEDKFNR